MDEKVMQLMSQFALVALVVVVLDKAFGKKAQAAPANPVTPKNLGAGPALVYGSYYVAPARSL